LGDGMDRIEEIISGFSGKIKSTYTEVEPLKYKRQFRINAPFLGNGQDILMTAAARKSGTIDIEFYWRIGQVISADCFLELLKMNFNGIYASHYVGILDSDDPPCYMLYLMSNYTVSESTPVNQAADIFGGDILSILFKPAPWPDGVVIWHEKEEDSHNDK
jgi:hypothetical protein